MSLDLKDVDRTARLPAGPGVRTRIDYVVNIEVDAEVLYAGCFRTVLAMSHATEQKGFDVVLTGDNRDTETTVPGDPVEAFWRYDDLVAVRA